MVRVGLFLAALLLAGRAFAADQPVYGPEAGWIKAHPIPAAPAAADGAPVQTLLIDKQTRLSDAGDDYYMRTVVKILSPQGLSASGQIAQTWDPATETLSIHHLIVYHEGKPVDALADGRRFLVLRRENNLELAVLDGRMTATIQPEGLEVGDVVDLAITLTRHDPALAGHSMDEDQISHAGVAGRVYQRTLWPTTKPVAWRATLGMDPPRLTREGGQVEAVEDLFNVVAPKPPAQAPYRFQRLGLLEFSDFRDWSEVSALMAPLYAKAETLRPGAPLQAEIARIAAASSDPRTRATAALRLVEERTRYVFLGMNDAGLIPADADETWARRFGDCKGKSALLVAVLKALGLDAEPALVNSRTGDGLDQRLPGLSWFDHVITRLVIDGHVYWLDGTRQGDLRLEDLTIPGLHWALPVQASGASLTRLDPPPLAQPMLETVLSIDASKGIAPPAPTHVEMIYRGDGAVAVRQSLMSAPRADFDRALRENLTKAYPWLALDRVDVVRDDAANTVRLTGDGLGRIDWQTTADGSRFYHAAGTSLANDTSFKREPGLNSDAPYVVGYPIYIKSVQAVTLPADGEFALVGPDAEARVAAQDWKRVSRIEHGVLRVEITVRSLAPEFPAAEAEAAGIALRALPRGEVVATYRPARHAAAGGRGGANAYVAGLATSDPESDLKAAEAGDPAAQSRMALRAGNGVGVPYDPAAAAGWARRAALQGYAKGEEGLGELLMGGVGVTRDPAEAAVWFRKAAEQGDAAAQYNLAVALAEGRGLAKDDAAALVWLRKAADQNLAAAQCLLGQFEFNGRGGAPRDTAQGLRLVRLAADQGYGFAQALVGRLYQTGMGVPRDGAQAAAWCRKAADQGEAMGETCLGLCYEHGDGVAVDRDQALTWLAKAAAKGDATAIRELAALKAKG